MILQAGTAYIDQHGLRQLSMRHLGAELGVEAMSLYRYVPSRDDLLDGIVEQVLEGLSADAEVHVEPQDGWEDYLVRLAHGVRRIALEHPKIFPLIATQPPQAPWIQPPLRSLKWIESFLGALTSSGFGDQQSVAAYRAFCSFLLGHLLLEVAALGADITPVETGTPEEMAESDLSDYPVILRLKGPLSDDRTTEEFEEALESLLNRLALLR